MTLRNIVFAATPLGSLPILEVDGKVVATSQAIVRHLAREFKLYGKNNSEHAHVDMVCEVLLDILNPAMKAGLTQDEKAKVGWRSCKVTKELSCKTCYFHP